MNSLMSFIPIISGIAICGCFIKLAAKLFKSTKISWTQAFVFGGAWFLLIIFDRVLSYAFDFDLSPLVIIPLNIILLVGTGAIFFKGRAKTNEGIPFGYAGGAQFSVFLIVMTFAMAVPLIFLVAHFKST